MIKKGFSFNYLFDILDLIKKYNQSDSSLRITDIQSETNRLKKNNNNKNNITLNDHIPKQAY